MGTFLEKEHLESQGDFSSQVGWLWWSGFLGPGRWSRNICRRAVFLICLIAYCSETTIYFKKKNLRDVED